MDAEDAKKWLKEPKNLFLVLLLSFAIILRLYYFFKIGSQPIWWDEGDYLAISKVWALGQSTPEWWGHFTGMRPLLMPIIWTLFFKIGLGELSIRFFTILLPSIIAIYFVFLIGTEFYNKWVGLTAGFIFSSYWVFMFYSYRLLTDIPATLFGLVSIYYFYRHYFKEKKQYEIYISLFFGALAFSTRYPLALVLITCFLFLFITKRFSILKDKSFWKGIAFLLLIASPFIIYVALNKFYFIWFYFINGLGGVIASDQPFGFYVFGLSLSILKIVWIILFFIGLLTFYKLFLGFEIFLTQKSNSMNADAFILLWIIIQYVFYVFVFRGANDRWIIMLTIPMIIVASKGLEFVYRFVERYSKIIAVGLVVIILAIGGYQNLMHTDQLIDQKRTSYGEIKLGGEWLKDNTPQDAKIITASIVQNQYYSERQSYDFRTNDSIWGPCTDLAGAVIMNETCQNATEKAFDNKVKNLQPDYLIVSVFEPIFTPQWAYTYPQRHNLTAVQGYTNSQGQPMLIIYKF